MSLTQSIACTLHPLTLGDLPPEAIHAARLSLIYGLAVMLAATTLEPAARAVAALLAPGPATVLAGGTADVSSAALANGALAHALDFEDTHDATGMHPHAVAIPTLLALAEMENATLGSLLTALSIASDTTIRLAQSMKVDPAQQGWYHPPMLSAAGAAMGAAHLLRLTPEETASALSLTQTQFALTDALKKAPASHLRALRDGFAARAAVDGVRLAKAGFVGTPDPVGEPGGIIHRLTGATPDLAVFDTVGAVFQGQNVSLKLWPACRGTHPAIQLALDLVSQRLRPSDIERVQFTVAAPDDMLLTPLPDKRAPTTPIGAKFSIPYTFAHTMVQGAPGLGAFFPDALQDKDKLALAAQVEMAGMGNPSAEITLKNGQTFASPLPNPPEMLAAQTPMEALAEKHAACMEAAKRPLRVLSDIYEASADEPVRKLLRMLSPDFA